MNKYWLIVILILAAALRLYGLDRGDTVNDEVFYAFRAIGMLDFDKAEVQTTPLEWWDGDVPWWTKLSFHDHPPLVFWVQHVFMKVLGDERWAFRLPSVLFGVASVYFIYLIGRKLFSQNVGLLAAALFAVTLNSVYISRTGMQESYVIFFMLLASYLFLKNYFVWTGVVLGLAFLTKYNTFILVPIFLTYSLIYRRDIFRNKKFWLGAVLALLIFSPVIVYNYEMFRAVWHFDFQLSYIFGQNPPEWQSAPGKEIGTIGDRIKNFFPRLIATNSWLFLILFAVSFLGLLLQSIRKPTPQPPSHKIREGGENRDPISVRGGRVTSAHVFLILIFVFLFLLLLLIGPAYRFVTMLTPWMAIAIGGGLGRCLRAGLFFQAGWRYLSAGLMRRAGTVSDFSRRSEAQPPRAPNAGRSEESDKVMLNGLLVAIIAAIVAFEIFYSYNNQIAYYPKGPAPWLASKVRYENYNWGYNELNDYLEHELSGKMPALAFTPKYQFLNKLQDDVLAKDSTKNLEPYPALFVYYGNVDDGPRLWTFDRLHFYHAWPIINFDTYKQFLAENGTDFYQKMGFKNYYFIMQTNIFPSAEFQQIIQVAEPELIKNPRGDIVFKVFKFVL